MPGVPSQIDALTSTVSALAVELDTQKTRTTALEAKVLLQSAQLAYCQALIHAELLRVDAALEAIALWSDNMLSQSYVKTLLA